MHRPAGTPWRARTSYGTTPRSRNTRTRLHEHTPPPCDAPHPTPHCSSKDHGAAVSRAAGPRRTDRLEAMADRGRQAIAGLMADHRQGGEKPVHRIQYERPGRCRASVRCEDVGISHHLVAVACHRSGDLPAVVAVSGEHKAGQVWSSPSRKRPAWPSPSSRASAQERSLSGPSAMCQAGPEGMVAALAGRRIHRGCFGVITSADHDPCRSDPSSGFRSPARPDAPVEGAWLNSRGPLTPWTLPIYPSEPGRPGTRRRSPLCWAIPPCRRVARW